MTDPLVLTLSPETLEAIARRAAELVLKQLGDGSPWMDRKDAARYLSLPASRLEKDKGIIPCHREGRRVLYHRDELDAYLQA